jgi:hypothetical protein
MTDIAWILIAAGSLIAGIIAGNIIGYRSALKRIVNTAGDTPKRIREIQAELAKLRREHLSKK